MVMIEVEMGDQRRGLVSILFSPPGVNRVVFILYESSTLLGQLFFREARDAAFVSCHFRFSI